MTALKPIMRELKKCWFCDAKVTAVRRCQTCGVLVRIEDLVGGIGDRALIRSGETHLPPDSGSAQGYQCEGTEVCSGQDSG